MSERPGHRMFEQWQPLGPVLCICAFNFPVAVWSWNAAIALVCGDPVVWKPSLKAALCGVAVHGLLQPVLEDAGHGDAMQLVVEHGPRRGRGAGRRPPAAAGQRDRLVRDGAQGRARGSRRGWADACSSSGATTRSSSTRPPTSSSPPGRSRSVRPGPPVSAARRRGGCSWHASVADELIDKLVAAYRQLGERIGDPRDREEPGRTAHRRRRRGRVHARALEPVKDGRRSPRAGAGRSTGPGYFVQPTLVAGARRRSFPLMDEETFAPILYVRASPTAISPAPSPPRTRSSRDCRRAIFTDSVRAAERFWSPAGCRLRHRQRQPRDLRGRDRRGVRRREGDRRRPRGRLAMRGRPTCGARPARSTDGTACRWRRASSGTDQRAACRRARAAVSCQDAAVWRRRGRARKGPGRIRAWRPRS